MVELLDSDSSSTSCSTDPTWSSGSTGCAGWATARVALGTEHDTGGLWKSVTFQTNGPVAFTVHAEVKVSIHD